MPYAKPQPRTRTRHPNHRLMATLKEWRTAGGKFLSNDTIARLLDVSVHLVIAWRRSPAHKGFRVMSAGNLEHLRLTLALDTPTLGIVPIQRRA